MQKVFLGKVTNLTIVLGMLIAIDSYFGSFVSLTYKLDTPSLVAQGIEQDFYNLFIIIPFLFVSIVALRKGKLTGYFMLSGALFYIIYSYFIYAFGFHFNQWFLVYCSILGISFYMLVAISIEIFKLNPANWLNSGFPVKSAGIFLLVLSVLFVIIWLGDIIHMALEIVTMMIVMTYKGFIKDTTITIVFVILASSGAFLLAKLVSKLNKVQL